MAANDEFPRGWTLTNGVAGAGTAIVTVPAVVGVAHILDSVILRLLNTGAGALFATNVNLQGAFLTELIVPAAVVAVDDVSLTGMNVSSTVGGTLIVTFTTPATAGISEIITIQGHDI